MFRWRNDGKLYQILIYSSDINNNCFQSKTYDSVTEKYLDFSFEKTNSAYMLFYEWRSGKGGNEQRNQSESPTSLSPGSSISHLQETGKSDEAHASTSSHGIIFEDVKQLETVTPLSETAVNCDLDIMPASTSRFLSRKSDDEIKSLSLKRSKRKSLLNKELEEWIWQDNRHYLEDRNIFEHTYFK
jgi:ubiquitin carboxyl-terminal hydrolase 34